MKVRNYRSIQALRGLAACIVVIHHASQLWSDAVPQTKFWNNGAAGVDIFFVISGFVMALTYSPDAATFINRRLIRVVPLYWLMTTVFLLKMLAVKSQPSLGHGAHADISIPYVAASYLFLPYRDSRGHVLPVLPVGWTLSFEMFFYACFAAVIALRMEIVRTLGIFFAALVVVGFFFQSPSIMTLTNPILLEFIAGLWLGNKARSSPISMNRIAMVLSASIGFIGILAIPFPSALWRVVAWGVPAFLIVLAAVVLERDLNLPEWTQKLGDASYSLYLGHMIVFVVCRAALLRLGLFGTPHFEGAAIAIFLVASVAAALVIHKYVEHPLTATLNRWTRPKNLPDIPLQAVHHSRSEL